MKSMCPYAALVLSALCACPSSNASEGVVIPYDGMRGSAPKCRLPGDITELKHDEAARRRLASALIACDVPPSFPSPERSERFRALGQETPDSGIRLDDESRPSRPDR